MIRVMLPQPLRKLAGVPAEVKVDVAPPVTARTVLDALETAHPKLRGTIRDRVTQQRRPYVRYFACRKDWSHRPCDQPLPDAVCQGTEPFIVLGAVSGG